MKKKLVNQLSKALTVTMVASVVSFTPLSLTANASELHTQSPVHIVNKAITTAIAPEKFEMYTDSYVQGTFTGDIKTIKLFVEGGPSTGYAGGTVHAGVFKFYAKDKIRNSFDKVTLKAYNTAGQEVDSKVVSLTNADGEGTISANEFLLRQSRNVEGTYVGNISRVRLKVGETEYAGGTVADGKISFYAVDKIRNTTEKVTLIGFDKRGNKITEQAVKVGELGATLTPNQFELYTDSYVKGTFTGDVKTIKLFVEGRLEGYTGGVVSGGTFQFYAKDKIRNAFDKVTLKAYNAVGREVDSKDVTIKNADGTGTITTNDFVLKQSNNVEGTYEGNISSVRLKVGESLHAGGTVSNGKITFYAADKITNATDKVILVGYDKRGNKITEKPVNITIKDEVVPTDPAAAMINPEDKVLVGYWHNWPAGNKDGYQQGSSAAMDLTDIRKEYNVIDASFMKSEGNGTIPTFKPYNMTDAKFRDQIGKLNQEGRAVIMALGGADAHIELKKADKAAFVAEIIRMVDVYGFDGLDIDLEQSAITAGDNETVIPEALREVKDHYKAQNKNFLITMAPEFPYLKPGAAYEAYIKGLDGYYDWINPQLYNQSGDGLWVDELNMWLTQSNNDLKAEFLYYMADSLSKGTRGFLKIPANKLVLGLPTNNDAAATGYVINPLHVKTAMDRLATEGNPIKGLMTWSVNWDAGKDKDGKAYNWEFVNRYAPMLFKNTQATN